MQEFKIFTEGIEDVKFLKDFVAEKFEFSLIDNEHIEHIGSWSDYKKGGTLKASIRLNHDNGRRTILILDADDNIKLRRKEVSDDFNAFGVPVDLFLSPNNLSTGNLETLLCEIAVERQILACFDAYETCIKDYKAPIVKARIFAYLDALLPDKHTKGGHGDLLKPQNRNYRNTAHWDLHHAYLQPLHDFLVPFFK